MINMSYTPTDFERLEDVENRITELLEQLNMLVLRRIELKIRLRKKD